MIAMPARVALAEIWPKRIWPIEAKSGRYSVWLEKYGPTGTI
jgi:hypothetical protein